MLEFAKVLKSNGTEGDLLIGIRDVGFDEIDLKEPVYIDFDGLPVPFFIASLTPKGTSKAVVHLVDVDSLRDAEEMAGRSFSVDYLEYGEDEEDFTGWTLLDKGKVFGTVDGVEYIPGNPCLCIGDMMIPLHEDLILSCDPEQKILDMDLPEGLGLEND